MLYLLSLSVTQPTATVPTGTLHLEVGGTAGDEIGISLAYLPSSASGLLTASGPDTATYSYAGIPVGRGYAGVAAPTREGRTDTVPFSYNVDAVPEPAQPGCTDPQALNLTPGANQEDGSCLYTPPVATPFFAVPLLQALRFVLRGGPGVGFDELLFCEQPRPGQQVRPHYYQLVENGDEVRVQVLTSYPGVTASLFRHGGAQVGPDVALTRALVLSGPSTPLNVLLSEDAPTGTTRLRAAAGGSLPPSLLAAARLTLGGAAGGTYRLTQAVPGSVVALDDYLVLNRPWVAPAAGTVTASWLLTGPGYNVWEAVLPLASLAAGYYFVKLRAAAPGWPSQLAESEPLHLKAHHANTVAVDYRNSDNCFGLVFATGITPRVRALATFFRQKNGGTLSAYSDSAAQTTVLSSTATRLTTLETYGQPAYVHEKLFVGCRLDYLAVNGERCVSPAAYETSELRPYPLSGGHADLQKAQWLGQGNGDDNGLDENAPDNALGLRQGGYLLLRG